MIGRRFPQMSRFFRGRPRMSAAIEIYIRARQESQLFGKAAEPRRALAHVHVGPAGLCGR